MKVVNGAMLFTSLSVFLWGCADARSEAAKAGRQRWLATKATCATYHYSVTVKTFAGATQKTSIEVNGDTPTARMFVSTTPGAPLVIEESWTEVGVEVGTHAGATAAAPPRTMEQLYDDCVRDVLSRDPDQNQILFQADSRGVVQSCSYLPNGCFDDCRKGDVVTDFACEPLDLTPIRP